eukprot:scaffold600_cov189-Amphora_coffeaeformis.AAC.1
MNIIARNYPRSGDAPGNAPLNTKVTHRSTKVTGRSLFFVIREGVVSNDLEGFTYDGQEQGIVNVTRRFVCLDWWRSLAGQRCKIPLGVYFDAVNQGDSIGDARGGLLVGLGGVCGGIHCKVGGSNLMSLLTLVVLCYFQASHNDSDHMVFSVFFFGVLLPDVV